MSMDSQDMNLKFKRSSSQAYGGFKKTAVLPEDAELTHTDPGTPMGNLMRRFWQPVCLSEELTDVPRAIRILGEDLVAFRDKSGQVGVLHRQCSHRGASLEYGIIQDTGIRCCYHGFQYNVDGTLMNVPGEPDGGERMSKTVAQGAYPAFERYGMVFAYMGDFDEMPKFPEWEFFHNYDDLEFASYSNIYPCNWLQVFDNIPDQMHTCQLHSPTMRVISDDDDGSYPSTAFNPVFAQIPVMEYASVRDDTAMVFSAGRRVGKDRVWVRLNDVILPNLTLHPHVSEEGAAARYFHRIYMARWYVPVDNENSIIFGIRMFGESIDPFGTGDKSECGYNRTDFLDGQTGNRPREVAQRMPGDWDAVTSQRAIARHAMENPTKEDVGVYMNRKNLRRAVRNENPHMEQAAIHARANAGLRNNVYTNNTILDIPLQEGRDDDELVREVCKKVLEIAVAGDAYEGAERDTFIQNALRDYEQSFASAAAAE
ncbi:MAG: Rieske 2Fe-2S domain-containing protein [Rhodospirillaceae bacterium]|nr:Rieske 2Fe-2S domain-containing protein [Rhodospirillaceae bacterium]